MTAVPERIEYLYPLWIWTLRSEQMMWCFWKARGWFGNRKGAGLVQWFRDTPAWI
jgi:hypothetical protein